MSVNVTILAAVFLLANVYKSFLNGVMLGLFTATVMTCMSLLVFGITFMEFDLQEFTDIYGNCLTNVWTRLHKCRRGRGNIENSEIHATSTTLNDQQQQPSMSYSSSDYEKF